MIQTVTSTDGSTRDLGPEALGPQVEAVLISADRPVNAGRLAVALGLVREEEPGEAGADRPGDADACTPAEAEKAIAAAIEHLNGQYDATERSFRIEEVAGGFRVMTRAAYAGVLRAFHRTKNAAKLSKPAVETLAIIAYRQPITRAELEAIRGVSCGEVLKSLMERRLVTIKGRAEELGRPILYGTTKQFLDHFGLPSLADLPTLSELKPTL